jgi:hypothetical protein
MDPDSPAAILRRAVEREAPGARTLESGAEAGPAKRGGLLESCSNPQCRTGWLQLWRSRGTPVFEGGWTCSPACTAERLREAVRRERKGQVETRVPHRHRIPLGLLMLEQGWITSDQLRGALASQKKHGGRLGRWLVRQHGVSEEMVTRALALQWSCPALRTGSQNGVASPDPLAALVPRLFVDAFGALPVRLAGGKVLYLGFEDRPDPALALAVERMTGLRVECGVVADSEFAPAHERILRAKYPSVELVEAASEEALVRALGKAIERSKPVWARLVRAHDFLWLRMARMARKTDAGPVPEAGAVEDVIATIGG